MARAPNYKKNSPHLQRQVLLVAFGSGQHEDVNGTIEAPHQRYEDYTGRLVHQVPPGEDIRDVQQGRQRPPGSFNFLLAIREEDV